MTSHATLCARDGGRTGDCTGDCTGYRPGDRRRDARAPRVVLALMALVLAFFATGLLGTAGDAWAQAVRPPAEAVSPTPSEPGLQGPRDFREGIPDGKIGTGLEALGANSDSELWRAVRAGEQHSVSIPNARAGILVQSAGASWISWRDSSGPLVTYGAYALVGILVLLALFFLLRGRIKVDHGMSGQTILRFTTIERMGHWLLAGSFILLALTGLNVLMGKAYLMPLIGKEAFATVSIAGKWIHNNVAWAFMAGLLLTFVLWVSHNIPHRTDLKWMLMGGGLFVKGMHPPARKFNAGQKLIFWSTMVLGASISASGLSLLFPYELPMFAATFEKLNQVGAEAVLGYALPTQLSAIQEMQYAQIWHTIVSIVMIVIIVAHIYIGSIGMQGAFAAMGSGEVDRNWALEHHSLWVEEEDERVRKEMAAYARQHGTPAE
ncbi:MAG: formate dehydrogenase subunit gamma [Pseudomonadota bacterium]